MRLCAGRTLPPARGRFGSASFGTDQAQTHRFGSHGSRQHTGGLHQPPVQRELTHRRIFRQLIFRQNTELGEHRQRDGEIVMAAFLWQIGRREIHDDTLGRQGEAQRGKRRAHPFPAFTDRLVRQADDLEGDLPARQLDLHVDRLRLDAVKRECGDPCDHPGPSAPLPKVEIG